MFIEAPTDALHFFKHFHMYEPLLRLQLLHARAGIYEQLLLFLQSNKLKVYRQAARVEGLGFETSSSTDFFLSSLLLQWCVYLIVLFFFLHSL